jgi:hypothetical protein
MNCTHLVKQPNLKMKALPKQLLGFLPLTFELPRENYWKVRCKLKGTFVILKVYRVHATEVWKTLPNIRKCNQNIQTQIESSKQFWLTFQCFAICAEYCTLEQSAALWIAF